MTRPTSPSSTAVLLPNWIGDLILALSVILRKKLSDGSGPLLIVPERLCGLTALLCDLPIIPYRRKTRAGYFATIRAVRERSVSKLYILPHSFSSALFGFLSGIPRRRGVSAELRGALLTERLPPAVASRSRHLTYEYSAVLETALRDPGAWDGVAIEKSAEADGAIVLCPGAAYGPAKQWPHFARLVGLFDRRRFIVVGDDRDHAIGERIAAAAPDRVMNSAGSTTLERVASLIATADLVVSNDSGLLHLAGFLGTPCIGIYGSTSSVWTGPLGGAVAIARGECRRSPCYERTCPEKHYNCLAGIPVERVATLANELLARHDNPAGAASEGP
jgi:heptosyltransferase-2